MTLLVEIIEKVRLKNVNTCIKIDNVILETELSKEQTANGKLNSLYNS
ncbi:MULTISPECIES: hypothetical protein [Gemella]|nr:MULTISPECIES: hypothetical protein [Gemella]